MGCREALCPAISVFDKNDEVGGYKQLDRHRGRVDRRGRLGRAGGVREEGHREEEVRYNALSPFWLIVALSTL